MEYKIVWHSYFSQIEEIVQALLKEGWKLHGGLSVAVTYSGELYIAQAMVRNYD